MNLNSPLAKWLKTQEKEFVKEILNNKLTGDGSFTIEKLRELDERFNNNPEDENARRTN